MLRDIPKIYVMLFGFILVIGLLTLWYTSMFGRNSDTLQLNDILLSNAVSEVDQTSRLYEGALLLSDNFEVSVWDRLELFYKKESTVQFDYLFDTEDDRFDNVEKSVSSPTYILGGSTIDVPRKSNMTYMMSRPIISVRVKIHEAGDKVGEWTYVSTVTVDAASKPR